VLPEVFRKPYAGALEEGRTLKIKIEEKSNVDRGRRHGEGVEVANLTAALRQMNPCDWRNDYPGWFALLTACQFAGIPRREFVDWSLGDPHYAADRRDIERIWDSARPKHAGALWKALAERGIKVTQGRDNARSASLYLKGPPVSPDLKGPPVSPGAGPTLNLRRRASGLFGWLAGSPTEQRLFVVAATFAEMIAERAISRQEANYRLKNACKTFGLWRMLGPDGCQLTITNAFRHVEEKILGERK
jgi:hypothetical protein